MENNESLELEKIQSIFDIAITGFAKKAIDNKISLSEWAEMYNIYQKAKAVGIKDTSLSFLAKSLLTAQVIINDNSLEEKYSEACKKLEEGFIKDEDDENIDEPKILTPHNSLDRGIELSKSLSSDFGNYKESMQRRREERYQSMIDELPPIESPMDRRYR